MHWIFKAAAVGAAAGWATMKATKELESKGYSPEVQAAIVGAASLIIFLASVGIVGAATEAAADVAGV